MANKFFLPDDYVENIPLTFSEHPRDYWTTERIKSPHEFQYHVYEYAGRLFKKKGYKSLLDIGAGPGTKLPFFFDLNSIELGLIDQPGMDEITLKTCPNASFYGANLETDRVEIGRKYDMIICSDVIEHLGDPSNLIDIIKRHLKEDGVAIISTPDRLMRRGKDNRQSPNKAHVREWSSNELNMYLVNQNFKIKYQRNFPLKRLSPLEMWLSQNLSYRLFRKVNWFGNQLILVSHD